MAVEIEKKYRLPKSRGHEILNALERLGAKFLGEDFEENIVYDGGPLTGIGAALRLRKTQDRALLTFKKRMPSSGGAKHQLEHETEVADAASVDMIIRELGMSPSLIYEKRRKKWDLRGVEVVLDELPFGDFVEIEGQLTAILEAELLLGIDDLEQETQTYPSLTRHLGRPNGSVVEARFK